MALFGCDLSDFDRGRGPVDVGAMARDGVSFLTHKATEGTKVQHAYYGQTLNAARDAGIPFIGAYIVVRTPGSSGHGSIAAQVAYFLAYLDAQTPWWRTHPGFFLQVDTEHWSDANGHVYDAVAPQYGAQACDLLRAQTGKWVVHYAPRWAYGDTIPGDDPLWASAYGTNPAVPYRQAYPGDGSSGWAPYSGRTPTFLQFGERLTIGSQPGCDANAYCGTLDQLRALITGKASTMTLREDPDGAYMYPRVDAAANLLDVYPQGPEQGHGVPLVALLKELRDNGSYLYPRMEALAGMLDTYARGPEKDKPVPLVALLKRIDTNSATTAQAATAAATAVGPTQAQVDAAILKAMLDPAVQKGIGDAIASHLKVS